MAYKKGFTLVELVIVIAVIAILAGVLIATFSGVLTRADRSADETLLANMNRILLYESILGDVKTTNDAYAALKKNGISKENIIAKQTGYRFAYDKDLNRFIYEPNGFFEADPVSYTGSDYKSTLFGAEVSSSGKGLVGYNTYTGSTTYTYKYLVKGTNEVISGETVTEDNTLTYWLHIPENYKSYNKYPLITYIHGSGGCLFLQENCDAVNVNVGSENSFWNSNTSYWMGMQNPNKSGRMLKTSFRDDFTSIAQGSAFGNTWDSNFISSWFSWVKEHPEDDCFIVFVEMNDEIWFDNLGTYTVDDKQCEMLCIYNSYKAGNEYGQALTGGSGKYNTTYNSDLLGPNVWFQLLTQLQDNLMEEYNIDNLYVIGASLGGISALDLISHYPTRFKAAFPCAAPCADITDENITAVKNGGTIVYAYHGASDGAVSYLPGKTFCEKLTEAGGVGVFKSVPGLGHVSTPLALFFDDIIEVIKNCQSE